MSGADVRRLLGLLLPVLLIGVACDEGPSSQLEPGATTRTLTDGAAAQLCRFTTDMWADTAPRCGAEDPAPYEFEDCRAAPPWLACSSVDMHVEEWEQCVLARAGDPCAAAPCEALGCAEP